jgi:Spy/CpxP family protein refolding chaperone
MNQRLILLAAAIVAGAATAYFLPKGTKPIDQVANSEVVKAASEPLEPPAAPEDLHVPKPLSLAETPTRRIETPKVDPPPPSAWAKLAEKYGPEKTAVSSKITSNLTSLVNQGIELANTAARNSGSASVAEAATKEILRNASGRLGLTPEQQQQASTVIQTAVNKRMAAVTDLTSAMSSEPEQIMEMLLAGDALARNDITRDEYDRITLPTRTMLQNMAGFITGQPGSIGNSQVLMDSETAAQINAILTPEQQAKLAELTASMTQRMQERQNRQAGNATGFQPGQIPIMDLGKMDQAVASMQQMAAAARQMMEAMKGLKEANSNNPGSQ